MEKKNKPAICVFCGSSFGTSPRFREAARDMGAGIAALNFSLVFGGGVLGLMGEVADAVRTHGGMVTGIIPAFLERRPGIVDPRYLHEITVTDTMHARKNRMFELADAFVALPGGIGTLEETIEILTWAQLELHVKPVIIVNLDGYWDHLVALLDAMGEKGFLDRAGILGLHVVPTVADALATLSQALNRSIAP